MIIETSTDAIRSEIGHLLADYLLDPRTSEATALQVIEIIAFRMHTREDYQVATVGAFVRINLHWLHLRKISCHDAVERFTRAAAYACLGHRALADHLTVAAFAGPR